MTLSDEDRELVEESIAHWERMRDDPDGHDKPFRKDCALCGEHWTEHGCPKCPVENRVDYSQCCSTPYDAAFRYWNSTRTEYWDTVTWRGLAQAEIDFLKGLLEEK